MTDGELHDGLSRLFNLGFLPGRSPPENIDEVLAGLSEATGPEDRTRGPLARRIRRPRVERPKSEDSQQEIDFGEKSLIGKRDSGAPTTSLEARKFSPGTLLFVGFALDRGERKQWRITGPTPFNRDFQAALAATDNEARTLALLGLAARLSWSLIKETILLEAARSARMADIACRDRLIERVAASYPERDGSCREEVELAPEPVCDASPFHGRFVMLRDGPDKAVGRVRRFALEKEVTVWQPFCKVVHFAAEVEAAPLLLRRSLEDGCSLDPESVPFWREWIGRELAANAFLRDELLTLALEKD